MALRDYAALSAKAGLHDRAAAIIAERLDALDPTEADDARERVVAIEAAAAERLLLAGDATGAAALLRKAISLTKAEWTRTRLLELATAAEQAHP